MKIIITKLLILIFFIIVSPYYVQCQTNTLKTEAQGEMKAGRYGQAIDLLNRYVSANPQEAEGYNLRGLCYEKRNQYEMAVYDFRSARKCKNNSNEINQNLARATDSWYKLLYNKIEGHKREIAINPQKALNYLEIGKSYKNLGEWLTAEAWYDKYLPLEEASPDEIIRYSEILAKNNHIQKGEPILKKYTDKYPMDQRLWSRYGYFELWLGKRKNAIDAFEKALAIKPYFKEAMDGLDQAKGNGYIYTVNDTSYKHGKVWEEQKPQEFAIDKFYRILKNNPDDNNTRFALVDELVKYNRIDEAYNQMIVLQGIEGMAGEEKFTSRFQTITQLRDSIYTNYVSAFKDEFAKNNNDKEACVKLAEGYAHLMDFDNATDVLGKYLATVKENESLDVRYMYERYLANNYNWNEAQIQSKILLKYDPDNKNYRLFADQIIGYTNSSREEIDYAAIDLDKIIKDDPSNLPALLTMVYLNARRSDFTSADKYFDLAKNLDPKGKEVEGVGSFLQSWKLAEPIKELWRKRGEVGKLVEAGDFDGAEVKYDEIMSNLENPEKDILFEYALIKTKVKKYDKAISIYSTILNNEYDIDVDVERAKLYYYMGDSTKSVEEFFRLAEKKPTDFYVNLYLTDSYLKMRQFDKARNVLGGISSYIKDSTMVLDSTQTSALNLRYKWLPASGWTGFIAGFGRMALSPNFAYYRDNHGFESETGGLSVLLGINYYFSIGVTFSRTTISSNLVGNKFSTFQGDIYFRLSDYISGATGFGRVMANLTQKKNINNFWLKYEIPETFSLLGSYESNDARIILFSSSLSFNSNANILKLSGFLKNHKGIKISSYFTYITVTDGNAANQFQVRIGKEFYNFLMIGYEFEYQNFSYTNPLYYSPQDFQSHSLWAEWIAFEFHELKLIIGGRLGYIPASDYVIRELYATATYNPLSSLIIQGKISVGSSYRFDSIYNSVSAYLSAYWSF